MRDGKTGFMHAQMLIFMNMYTLKNMSTSMNSRLATNNLTGNERDYAAFVPSSVYSKMTLGIWKRDAVLHQMLSKMQL